MRMRCDAMLAMPVLMVMRRGSRRCSLYHLIFVHSSRDTFSSTSIYCCFLYLYAKNGYLARKLGRFQPRVYLTIIYLLIYIPSSTQDKSFSYIAHLEMSRSFRGFPRDATCLVPTIRATNNHHHPFVSLRTNKFSECLISMHHQYCY
ncbi:hypothetical protein BU24DRAFT_168979 [Aaosphaeria arxii CBS 175.79]|uniref:Uncharacterized protein n=1 Tax=Aaosphaeria arxii CBS 175.79 TaxID=1450172 RepID=A0A6A5XYI1_9PLEO|nr:uncharacterized protein BU24DRAFT_168979 [Aaosphaeria arxii CBS 175.79]KAF2018348.1 hypothetical protein BU24DRAFT_168979 [Aaosphaeria arxii CBS 175.79]